VVPERHSETSPVLSGERKLAVLKDPLTPDPSPAFRGRGEKSKLAVLSGEALARLF